MYVLPLSIFVNLTRCKQIVYILGTLLYENIAPTDKIISGNKIRTLY